MKIFVTNTILSSVFDVGAVLCGRGGVYADGILLLRETPTDTGGAVTTVSNLRVPH